MRHQEKRCETTLFGADGVVAHKPRCTTECIPATWLVNGHPVCAASVAAPHFFTGAATPPHEEDYSSDSAPTVRYCP